MTEINRSVEALAMTESSNTSPPIGRQTRKGVQPRPWQRLNHTEAEAAKQWLRQTYPLAFRAGEIRPLMIGVGEILRAAAPPELTVTVGRYLGCYVNSPRYLRAMVAGARRITLDGTEAGPTDPAHVEHARSRLSQKARGAGARP
jgi:ProP effector